MGRSLPILYDVPTSMPSVLLESTLEDFLPEVHPNEKGGRSSDAILENAPRYAIPFSHHLVYFPPPTRPSSLLPDDTDPAQSPGDPFVRRMWAGGSIRFPDPNVCFSPGGSRSACAERITGVDVKGVEGDERVFVTIERRISGSSQTSLNPTPFVTFDDTSNFSKARIREHLDSDSRCGVIEERNLVFMRRRSRAAGVQSNVVAQKQKNVKPAQTADFSHALIPTAALLFRFSALTFNAHRIHLDKTHCQDVEGHRNLLVHGPLSVVLMTEVLRRHLVRQSITEAAKAGEHPRIIGLSYRNLAPLYAEEPLTVCVKAREGGYDAWIVNSEGGLSVRGSFAVESLRDEQKVEGGNRAEEFGYLSIAQEYE